MIRPTFVLVPSPLLTGWSWRAVAERLEASGRAVVVAETDDADAPPYFRAHAQSAAAAVPDDAPYVLVAHSGAGALLPLVAQAAGQRPIAAIYVDAGLPVDGTTRLEQLSMDAPDLAVDLRSELAEGGVFPTWSDEQLAPLIPDDDDRRRLLDSVRPRGLDFLTEALAVPPGWDRIPSAYVRTSPGYDLWARIAGDRGWPVHHLDGGHFHLIADAAVVADAIAAAFDELRTQIPAPVDVSALQYDDRGLIPAVVQQHDTGDVLMVAWMNREAIQETLERGETVFWSRSRGERWHKGETSGNTQRVVEVIADCDADVLLVKVEQRGAGACHTGSWSCFERSVIP